MHYPGGNYSFREISRGVSAVLDVPSVTVPELVGSDPALRELMERAVQLAATDRPVLITGEPGTGKEALARWMHARSERAQHRFETFDGAGLDPAMAASDLFGHEKGAFSWATQTSGGLLAEANGGTLYIREVCDLDRALQNRLRRFLDRSYAGVERLGGQELHRVDVRIIAASSQPLSERLGEVLSPDLYDRLKRNPLKAPPLRARSRDIPALVKHFLARLHGAASRGWTCEPWALSALQSYQWPGNLDELEEVVAEAALKVGPGDEIKFDHLPLRIRNAAEQAGLPATAESTRPPRTSGDREPRPQPWPELDFPWPGYRLIRIINTTPRARVILAQAEMGHGFRIAKFSHARNEDQLQAVRMIMALREKEREAKRLTIPMYDADPCVSDNWCKIVLDCLDDAQTGRDIKPDLYQPHTFGKWITMRHQVPPPDGHDKWAVIDHIKAILNALHYFHQKDLVMNDAKPDNFGFFEGRLVTIDFGGFARRGVPPHEYDLAYSPPGPRGGQPAEDVYAVAVMLGEALYNIPPEELKPSQVKRLREPYLDKGLFDAVAWTILSMGLHHFPVIRYKDAPSMLKDLEHLEGLRGAE